MTMETNKRELSQFSLKLLSLNVRGLRQEIKRKSIFNYFRKKHADIVFIQESHALDSDNTIWKNQWGGEIVFSNWTSKARGVMVLFSPNLSYNIKHVFKDEEGRMIHVRIVLNDITYELINIYAPNTHILQKYFYQKMSSYLKHCDKFEYNNTIIGGDFNVILDPTLDRKGGNFVKTNLYQDIIDIIHSVTEELDLTDIWRKLYPEKRQFTWRQKNPPISSRLDIWFISANLEYYLKNIDIYPSIRSDHSSIFLCLENFESNKGNGYWKLNNSFLEEAPYIDIILETINIALTELSNVDERIKWEYMKYKIRLESIKYGKARASQRQSEYYKLENNLKLLQDKTDENDYIDSELDEEIQKLETSLKQMDNHKMEGLILQSRCKWYEEGERSTKYFLNLIKRNKTHSTMLKLQKQDGTYTTDMSEILKAQLKFYEDLYSANNLVGLADIRAYLRNINITKLNDNQRMFCEEEINMSEIETVLKLFRKNKTPGIDGLTLEFYLKFWNKLKIPLLDCFNKSIREGELSSTQKMGIITLLDKGKDKTLLKNWRPITLLNMDYKIFTKVLAERIKQILPNIIHHNQVGYVKNRNILDNIRTVADILHYTKVYGDSGVLVCIDFRKAFDSVSWDFMFETLGHFNFGPKFLQYIRLIYKNANSCIINNGNISESFTLGRGVRQGDPLSPYLFVLVAEILSQRIRDDENIVGLNNIGEELKILQYADDTCGCLTNIESAEMFLKQVENFGKYSGLVLNRDKTEAMWLGIDRQRNDCPLGITWVKKPLRILGVYMSYDEVENNKYNFDLKIKKCTQILNTWQGRNLTLMGRIQIIKTFIISQFLFCWSVINIPEIYVWEIKKMITNFIWAGKKPKLKYDVMKQSYENGGLKAPNVLNIIKTSQLKWIKKYSDHNEHVWKKYFRLFLQKNNIDLNILLCTNYATRLVNCLENVPLFYKNVLMTWSEYGNTSVGKKNIYGIISCYQNQMIYGFMKIFIAVVSNIFVIFLMKMDINYNSTILLKRVLVHPGGWCGMEYNVLS